MTTATPEKINVAPGKNPEIEKAVPVRTKKFDRTPSPLIKSLIVLGIISAAITMIFYVSKWKNNNDFATVSPATDSSIVAMNTTPIYDTVTAVTPVETPAIHHKMVHPVKSPDTITTTIDYPDGKYVGQVVANIKNGLGTFFWNDGDRYSGYFVNGEKEGKGTFYYKNRDQYIGDWKNGKKNGMGTLYTSELTYEGEFLDDYFDGFGELKASENRIVTNCPDCKTYKGYWKEDLKEGFGECYDKDGLLLYQGKFSDDQPVEEYPNVERNKK